MNNVNNVNYVSNFNNENNVNYVNNENNENNVNNENNPTSVIFYAYVVTRMMTHLYQICIHIHIKRREHVFFCLIIF